MNGLGFFLFGRFFPWYGTMIAAGLLVALPLAAFQLKRFGLNADDFAILCGISALFGIVGAKLLYWAVSYREIDFSRLSDISYLGTMMSGGFVFLGGVLGLFPALWLCKKKLCIPVQLYFQACIGCLPIVHAFGRIGCFLVGCCHGIPWDGPFAMIYTNSPFAPHGVGLFPVQLVETLIEFALGAFLLICSQRLPGLRGLLLYLTVYSFIRFILEFLRGDATRGTAAGLSTSQLLSLLLFATAGSLLWIPRPRGIRFWKGDRSA